MAKARVDVNGIKLKNEFKRADWKRTAVVTSLGD